MLLLFGGCDCSLSTADRPVTACRSATTCSAHHRTATSWRLMLHPLSSPRRPRSSRKRANARHPHTAPFGICVQSACCNVMCCRPVHSVFTADEGGTRGMNANGQFTNEVYYMGIIDILTEYGTKKKLETGLKSFKYDKVSFFARLPHSPLSFCRLTFPQSTRHCTPSDSKSLWLPQLHRSGSDECL